MKKNIFTLYTYTTFKKNRVRGVLSMFLLASFFLFIPMSHAQNSQATWQKYLEYLKNVAAKDCVGDLTQLKLLKYTYKGKIKSEKDKSRVIETLYADKAPVVSVLSKVVISDTTLTATDITIRQKTYPKFEIATVRQMVDAGKLTQDSIATIKQRLYKDIEIGNDYLELNWCYKGKKFHSLFIMSNDGIPIEPITASLSTGGSMIINGRIPINNK